MRPTEKRFVPGEDPDERKPVRREFTKGRFFAPPETMALEEGSSGAEMPPAASQPHEERASKWDLRTGHLPKAPVPPAPIEEHEPDIVIDLTEEKADTYWQRHSARLPRLDGSPDDGHNRTYGR